MASSEPRARWLRRRRRALQFENGMMARARASFCRDDRHPFARIVENDRDHGLLSMIRVWLVVCNLTVLCVVPFAVGVFGSLRYPALAPLGWFAAAFLATAGVWGGLLGVWVYVLQRPLACPRCGRPASLSGYESTFVVNCDSCGELCARLFKHWTFRPLNASVAAEASGGISMHRPMMPQNLGRGLFLFVAAFLGLSMPALCMIYPEFVARPHGAPGLTRFPNSTASSVGLIAWGLVCCGMLALAINELRAYLTSQRSWHDQRWRNARAHALRKDRKAERRKQHSREKRRDRSR